MLGAVYVAQVTIMGTTVGTVPGTVPEAVRKAVFEAIWMAISGSVFGAIAMAILRPIWRETRAPTPTGYCFAAGRAILNETATAILRVYCRWICRRTSTVIRAAVRAVVLRA